MSSEACAHAARLGALNSRRRQLLARIASGAGLASALSALSALSACGGGPDDDATLRAVNATMDVASIDVQFNDWRGLRPRFDLIVVHPVAAMSLGSTRRTALMGSIAPKGPGSPTDLIPARQT
jgi:hypothetical protein